MCEPKAKEVTPGNIEVRCEISGKPITISNKYGMFCEDKCGMIEAKAATMMLDGFLKMFGPKD